MRLIDADALIETLKNMASDNWNKNVHTSWANAFEDVIDMMEDAPTIESERKKGRFVGTRYEGWVCSVCNVLFEDDPSYYNYCPNCGWQMER